MTKQMYFSTCSDVRKNGYAFRNGELDPDDFKLIEAHLEGCEACRDHLSKVDALLSASGELDFGQKIDKDKLFDRITFEMSQPMDQPKALFNNLEEHESESQNLPEPTRTRSRRGWYFAGIALAAGIAIGLLLPALMPSENKNVEPDLKIIAEKKPIAPKEIKSEPRILAYQPSPKGSENLKVYGDDLSNWNVTSSPQRQELVLSSGAVLVEYVPKKKGTTFTLVAKPFNIEVLGTVFFVDNKKETVGVVTGRVRVHPKGGGIIELTDGQQYVAGKGIQNVTMSEMKIFEDLVDVEQHNVVIAKVNARAEEKPDRKPSRYSKEVSRAAPAELRAAAEVALRDGKYALAAEFYERMVDEFSPSDPRNGTLRLDLSRIYIQKLRQPRRSVRHLRRFIRNRPNDPASPSAKKQLCEIVSDLNQRDPLCD